MSFISSRSTFLRSTGRAGTAPLTNEQIMRLAPSAFAVEKHESRSERYAYIPTSEVIDGLRGNGFVPMFAKQGNSRVPGKADFTKHLIRFRHEGQAAGLRQVGDTSPEVILVNSHDGTSAYKIMAGLFRLVCLNGMVVADRGFANMGSTQHSRREVQSNAGWLAGSSLYAHVARDRDSQICLGWL